MYGDMKEQNRQISTPASVIAERWKAGLFERLDRMTALTTVYDCTGANLGSFPVPPGDLIAGYVTGSGEVPWTPAQFSRYPGAVRIDQSPALGAFDETADVYDLEANAGTLDNLPTWVHGAWHSWTTGIRPGQRKPCLYCSRSTVTPAVNALLSAGITNGVYLWVADETGPVEAMQEVQAASGPFPVIGRQYTFTPNYDVSVVSAAWLGDVSKAAGNPKPQPGTQAGWAFCNKCQSLFYGPGIAVSHCPAGGPHNGDNSHSYTLNFAW